MNAVIVWTLSSGSNVSCGLSRPPATTAIVSPTARLIARMIEAMIPESAAGRTTLRTTSNLRRAHREGALAQAARDRPHRVLGDRGDQRRDEEADDDPAGQRREGADVPLPKSGLRTSGARKLMAKKPSTMVGMPAIVSRIGLTMLRTRGDA